MFGRVLNTTLILPIECIPPDKMEGGGGGGGGGLKKIWLWGLDSKADGGPYYQWGSGGGGINC